VADRTERLLWVTIADLRRGALGRQACTESDGWRDREKRPITSIVSGRERALIHTSPAVQAVRRLRGLIVMIGDEDDDPESVRWSASQYARSVFLLQL
jgi:hypothetical protein